MLITKHQWFLLCLLLAVAFVAEWQQISLPGTPKLLERRVDNWEVPAIDKAEPEQALDILSKTTPWGKLPEPVEQGFAANTNWRLLGTFAVGLDRRVLMQLGTLPAQQLKVGDTLPGGSTILKIEPDSLCLSVNGKKRNLAIYQQGLQVL